MKVLVRVGCGLIALVVVCFVGGMLYQAFTRPVDETIASTDYNGYHFEIERKYTEVTCNDCLDLDLFNFSPDYTHTDTLHQCDSAGHCLSVRCLDMTKTCDGFTEKDGWLYVKSGSGLFSIAIMRDLTETPSPALTPDALEIISGENIQRLEPIRSFTLPAGTETWHDTRFAFDGLRWLALGSDGLDSLDVLSGESTQVWQATEAGFSGPNYFTQNTFPTLYVDGDNVWVASPLSTNQADAVLWRLEQDGSLSRQIDLAEVAKPYIPDPSGRRLGVILDTPIAEATHQVEVWEFATGQRIAQHPMLIPTHPNFYLHPTQPILTVWDSQQWGLWNWETNTTQALEFPNMHPIGFSPSGDMLYFAGDESLAAFNMETRNIIQSPPLPRFESAEGLTGNLALMQMPDKVDFVDLATGQILTSIALTTSRASIRFSPDGRVLVFRTGDTFYFWGVVATG